MAAAQSGAVGNRTAPALSLVTDYGEHGSSCGYCGSKAGTSVTHGMMAESLSVECYQALVDRGWRRSGRWVYYPLHEHCCCQLLTIRLDVSRFAPNKEQRRVQRKWQAYLEGAPMWAPQAQQQLQGELGSERYPQQQQRGPAVGSPKRPHDEHAEALLQWGQPPLQQRLLQAGGSGEQEQEEGGAKRVRHANGHRREDEEIDGEERERRGTSPTAQLRDQLQHVLCSNLLPPDERMAQQQTQQELQQPQVAGKQGTVRHQPAPAAAAATSASATGAAVAAAGEAGEVQLASQLAAALQAAVAAGQLPPVSYSVPKVQQPTSKQRKVLPAVVTLTTAFPLAVVAAASKAQAWAEGGGKCSPEAVAELLLQHLPADLAAAAQVASGHLNFATPFGSGGAATSDGGGAGASAAGFSNARSKQPAEAQQRRPQQQQQQHPAYAAATAAKASASAAAAAGAACVPRGVMRHFEVRTLPSSEAGLEEVEFPLYRKYQVVHHGDKPSTVTLRSFRRFLVDTPLHHAGPEEYASGGCPPCGFGSFHQQYWLDGRLVAVGVVDVLPRCLSAKYLFWDTDLAPLSLGKLTSLKEIEWVRELQSSCPALRYYYLGFYIHNCHRMRYKGDFAPSDLLCPKNKCWVPLGRVAAALEQPGMVAISELPGALEGLGLEHLVDAATGQPTCLPREPTQEELNSFKVLLKLPGMTQSHMFTLGLLQQAGVLGGGQGMLGPLKKWWSRAGPAAAAMTAFAIE